jgi:nucleolar protein 56
MQKNSILITKKKIKDSFEKYLMIVQAVNNIKEIDTLSNTLVKRLREWYSYYLPELSRSFSSNEKFAEYVLKKEKKELLLDIRVNAEDSMGVEVSKKDVQEMKLLARQITDLYVLKKNHTDYIEELMKEVSPNVLALAGALIGAKLIALAGSLRKLSGFPASTVQILGAEKALFRHMKTGAKPPKYGILHEHPYVMKSPKQFRGKTARMLADKISIASKVDYFKGEFIGNTLRRDLEKKLPQ